MVKNPPANAGDAGSIPGSGRSPVEGYGNPRQYSCLENSMDGGAWRAIVRAVSMSQTQVRFLGWEDPLEKEMATHSSILAWEIP